MFLDFLEVLLQSKKLLQKIFKKKASVIFINENLHLSNLGSNENTNSYFRLVKAAEDFSIDLSRKIRDSVIHRKNIGSEVGKPKFGFRVITKEGKRKFIPDYNERNMISVIFSELKKHKKNKQIAELLNKNGLKRRGKPWTNLSVYRAVKDCNKTFMFTTTDLHNSLPSHF